jgi:class 3 adenylate cyclase/pimeloyl-ACP methyl ester carboxylesterase
MEIPKTRYARSADGAFIAYQTFGEGPIDLLWIAPWLSDLEVMWEFSPVVRFYREMASFARVVILDQRGIGLSDRTRGLPDLETRMDDVRAVLDAVGSERTVLWGAGPDGGALCAMYAATYPERVAVLAFWNAQAKALRGPDYPWGFTPEDAEDFDRLIEKGWGDEEAAPEIMRWAGLPSLADDPDAVQWSARAMRRMGSPGDVLAFDRMWNEIDFRSVLPSVHVPTIAIFCPDTDHPEGIGEYEDLVARVPGAKAVRLPPADFPPWAGDSAAAIVALRDFARATAAEEADFDRVLATVLFTDIVGSTERAAKLGDRRWTELLDAHHATVRAFLSRYRGREVDTAGDGFLATFDGPARAVRCATALTEAVGAHDLEIRAGVHTGEVELAGDAVRGLAVHVGARIASLAGPGEVLASSTVKDLVAGSGLAFEDAGEHELKGVPERWRVYRVLAG